MMRLIRILFMMLFGLSNVVCAVDAYNFDSLYSTIRICPGATFFVTNPISDFDGTLIRLNGGAISGADITFNDGLLEDAGNQLRLSAVFDPNGILTLNGSDCIRAYGGEVLQAITVSGFNNLIEGVPRLTGSITLQDMNTTISLAIQNNVHQNIELNGGTIVLEDNLSFGDDSILTVSGTVQGNGFIVGTGSANFTWNSNILWENNSHLALHACKTDLVNTFTFRGNTSINGNGNVFDLTAGQLIVEPNSSLFLVDLVLKGLGNDAGQLTLLADSSAIKMSNVDLEFVSTLTMDKGGIFIKGPTTAIIKDNNWVFDQSSSMTVDGVVLFLEQAGAETIGDIIFANEGSQLELLNSGTIKVAESAAAADGGLPALQSMIDMLKTSTGELQIEIDDNASMISMLKTSTGELQDQIDSNASMIDMLKTSTGDIAVNTSMIAMLKTSTGEIYDFSVSCCDSLQSQIDLIEMTTSVSTVISLIDHIESKVDSNTSMISMLKTSTGELQDQIDSNASMIDMLKTSTGDIAVNTSMIGMLKTSTGELQIEIDNNASMIAMLKTSTGDLQDQIDSNASMIDMLKTSTGDIAVNTSMIAMLKTSTGKLQTEIDNNASMIAMLKTSTGEIYDFSVSCCDSLQSQIDLIEMTTSVSSVISLIDHIESKVDSNTSMITMLKTSTGEIYDFAESCCESLQSQIDVIDMSTSVSVIVSLIDELESKIDSNTTMISMLKTSTGELYDFEESCCESLQSQIDVIDMSTSVSVIVSLIDELESKIDSNTTMISMLKTSTGEIFDFAESCCENLQSQIDVIEMMTSVSIVISIVDGLESRIDINSTMIDMLKTSTGELQDQIDSNASMIDMLKTSTGDNASMIAMLKTSTGFLQSQIDELFCLTGTCVICVTGDLKFDLSMLPMENMAVVFKFSECYPDKNHKPRVIFDPTCFGNDGIVPLPKTSRMLFVGDGLVDVKDDVVFDFKGTPFDSARSDWPALELNDQAIMVLDMNASVSIVGAGCVFVKDGSAILLDEESYLTFGNATNNDLFVRFQDGGEFIVDHDDALVSFQKATIDLGFENHSNLSILYGTVEFNTIHGLPAPGNMKNIIFTGGSALEIRKVELESGLLKLSPNAENVPMNFDNKVGALRGSGNIQFTSFDNADTILVDSILIMQNANRFAVNLPVVKIFQALTLQREADTPIVNNTLDELILGQFGSIPNPNLDGRCVVFCPSADGSVFLLQPGDHNVRYSSKLGTNVLNLILGYDQFNRPFQIDCETGRRGS